MRKKNSTMITSGILILSPLMSFAATPNDKLPVKPLIQKNVEVQNVNKTLTPIAVEKKEIFQPFTGKICAQRVRLRTQPNLEAHVIKELHAGELFAVIGEENEYYTVQAPKGMKGYVFRTFVLEDVVEGARVNVRMQPDTESPIIGQLNSGDRIKGTISEQNNKWLEIDSPATSRFYIAKEYVEKIGSLDLLEKQEQRRNEANQLLNTALLFGQSELRKPFEEIDLNVIAKQFDKLNDYKDIPELVEKAKETQTIIQETYIQKKIAFLEAKADRTTVSVENDSSNMQSLAVEKNFQDKLSRIGIDLQNNEVSQNSTTQTKNLTFLADNSLEAAGTSVSHPSVPIAQNSLTDKMRIWEPLEQSIFQIWAAQNGDKALKDFYDEEQLNATVLTGIVESYSRPVKNRPGDFILRIDNLPVAFLYSTKINLQEKIGQKVTVKATPRPNNNFAFPAYYVLSIE